MRNAFVVAVSAVVMLAPRGSAFGQSIQCVAAYIEAGEYRGDCMKNGSRIGSFFVRAVADRPVGLWRGAIVRASDSLAIVMDTRPGGALQMGRGWLTLSDVRADRDTLRFTYDHGITAPGSQADLDILRHAGRYLKEPTRWNRADTTDMAAAPIRGFSCAPASRQSLFCALYLASIEVTGDYAHFRPAIEAVRAALTRVSKSQYRHPLVDFNNDPGNDIRDIQTTIALAIEAIEQQRAKSGR